MASCSTGHSTPSALTPSRPRIKRLSSQSSSSSLSQLGTPSPKRIAAYTTHHPTHHRLALSDSNSQGSGDTTPATPCSPPAGNEAHPFAPPHPPPAQPDAQPPTEDSRTSASAAETGVSPSGAVVGGVCALPELAVAPPLPPSMSVPLAPTTLEAALMSALQDDGMDLSDWENEEEWLVKATPSPVSGSDRDGKKPQVRPLPRVPKLNLAGNGLGVGGGGPSARTPLTISARTGIAGRPQTARGSAGKLSDGTPPRSARSPPSSSSSSGAKTQRGSATARGASRSPPALQATGGVAQRSEAPTPRLVRSLGQSAAFAKVHSVGRGSQQVTPPVARRTLSVGSDGETPLAPRGTGSRIPKPQLAST